MNFVLFFENFKLELCPKIFIEDIEYPTNANLSVTVQSDGFSGNATMDIDVKDLCKFAANLCQIYNTLSGRQELKNPMDYIRICLLTEMEKGILRLKGICTRKTE